MNMEEIIKGFLVDQALIIVPALWVIGAIIKRTPKIPDWAIPYILLVLGIAGGLAIVSLDVGGAVQGILAAGAAVLGHQLVKQTSEAVKDYTEEGE